MFQLNDSSLFSLKTSGVIRNPELKDEIHCVALFVNAEHIKSFPEATKTHLLDVKRMCATKGNLGFKENSAYSLGGVNRITLSI